MVRKPFLQASNDGSTSTSTAGVGDVPSELRHPDLASRVAAKRQATSSSRAMADFEVFERLDAVIAAFLGFATSGISSSSTSDAESEVPVCVARYNDGTSELLSSKSLKTLCRFFNWRASLCALQAYVRPATPTATRTVGTYSRTRERRNKTPHHGRSQRSNETHDRSRATSGSVAASSATAAISDVQPAESLLGVAAGDDSSSAPSLQSLTKVLNQATEDVAFATDLSYAWPAEPSGAKPGKGHVSSLGKQDIATRKDRNLPDNRIAVVLGGSAGQLQRDRPPWPKSRVRVSHLETEFVIDQAGRRWFINAAKVWLINCMPSHEYCLYSLVVASIRHSLLCAQQRCGRYLHSPNSNCNECRGVPT